MKPFFDIFISYRRKGGFETAKHISDLLVHDGYTVSFDLDTLREGSFDTQLLTRIDECEDFIIIIDQHAFDRTLDPDFNPEMDWMRKELSHALLKGKNIIPILLSGASFPHNLPDDIRNVMYKNGPEYSQGYFDAFYQKLKAFLHSKPFERRTAATQNMACVSFYSDKPCYVKEAGKVLGEVKQEGSVIEFQKGTHRLVYVRVDNPSHSYGEEIVIEDAGICQTIDISFMSHPRSLDSREIDHARKILAKMDVCNDKTEFFSLCLEVAETGYPEGLYWLAFAYIHGIGVDVNVREGSRLLKSLLELANKGDVIAQYSVGMCYDDGVDIDTGGECEPDYEEAAKWFSRSAERGFVDAQSELGHLYMYNGSGSEEDEAKGAIWYKRAAEQGDAESQYEVGHCYEFGRGVEEDEAEAVKWYQRSAIQGNAGAQFALGRCYFEGIGVGEDNDNAVKWFKRSAEQGHAEAQYYLGICYYSGLGVPENYKEACKWYRLAAEQDFPSAQSRLGDSYANGEGVKQNFAEALKWFRRAASHEYLSDSHAQYMIGLFYYYGNTVEQDYSEAFEWFQRAAEKGEVDAMWKIATCYMKGRGVSKSRIEALKWFYAIPEEDRQGSVLDLMLED